MAQKQYSTKRHAFQRLTSKKRAQIEVLDRMKVSKAQIARLVGIARSTLYNELERGTVIQLDTQLRQYPRYFGDTGQRVYEEHRRNSRPPMKLVQAYEFVAYAEHMGRRRSAERLGVTAGSR